MKDAPEAYYQPDHWYVVPIQYKVEIPAKFVGLLPSCNVRLLGHKDYMPSHPQALFENVRPFDSCGFGGTDWISGSYSSRYQNYTPIFREVTEKDLWAVQAIERFQKALALRQASFSIPLPDGTTFECRLKPPKGEKDLPGKYSVRLVNPETNELEEGWFNYSGGAPSVRAFILGRRPGWHIDQVKRIPNEENVKDE
jgi:hypothetical protein